MRSFLYLTAFASVIALRAASDNPRASAGGHWVTDLQVRLRVEDRHNNTTFNSATPSTSNGSWLLSRFRAGLKGKFSAALSLYTQVQDSRELDSARPSVPFVAGSEGDDPLDLRQLYLDCKDANFTLRLGRQAIALGDERLVGPSEWNNFARTFDAVRLTCPKIGDGLDAFVASVVQAQPASTTGWHSNHSSADDLFAGLYGRFTPRPTLKLEPYALYRNKKTDTIYSAPGAGAARPFDIPQKITTLGVRWIGGPTDKLGGFDYDGDLAWQTGQVRGRQLASGLFAYFAAGRYLEQTGGASDARFAYLQTVFMW